MFIIQIKYKHVDYSSIVKGTSGSCSCKRLFWACCSFFFERLINIDDSVAERSKLPSRFRSILKFRAPRTIWDSKWVFTKGEETQSLFSTVCCYYYLNRKKNYNFRLYHSLKKKKKIPD